MLTESHMLFFTCRSCHTRLQVSGFYAGHYAPCPKCGTLILAPDIKALAVAPLPAMVNSVSESKLPLTRSDISQANVFVGKEALSKRQNNGPEIFASRMILADGAISYDEVEKKEHGNYLRMLLFVLLAILLIIIIFWLLNTLQKEGVA